MKKPALGFVCLFLLAWPAVAQKSPDDQEKSIRSLPDDTAKVNRWNALATDIQFQDPTRAIAILREATRLADALNYDYGLSVGYGLRATLFFYETRLDSSKLLLDKAFALVDKREDIPSRRQAAFLIQRYASIYQQRQRYDSAVLAYQDAAARFTGLGDKTKLIYCYYNLSNIYNSLADTKNASLYAHETFRIARQTGDSTFILRGYMALADAFISLRNYDSVHYVSRQGLVIANRFNNLFPIGKFHSLLGTYHDYRGRYDSSIFHFQAALDAYSAINLGYEVALTQQNIGHAWLQKKEYEKAIGYLEQGAQLSRQRKLDQVLRLCLADLVEAEEQRGRPERSFQYLKEYVAVNDSLQHRQNRQVVYDLETKYQTQKKEAQLQLQQNQIRQQTLVNYLLAGGIGLLSLAAFFMYYAYRQRRRWQEQRIRQLEKERQLSASEMVIKGQEEERGRLAKDLHDGLGGLLSGVKYSLTNMKSNVVLDAQHALAFERSLDMLDNAITELRRVAHNMMPEVLVRFGLVEAIKSYCESVRQSGIFQLDFQFVGLPERLDSGKEIIVYRLVQELLNNAAKHARATHVLVQVARHENEVTITVEDNGVGFDLKVIDQAKGAGWSSIRSRVDYLKGRVDIQSAPGAGTSVLISIPL